MFGFTSRKDRVVADFATSNIKPLFAILEGRLGAFPAELAQDPFVLGFIIGAATIFAEISTNGRATREVRTLAATTAYQAVFSRFALSSQEIAAAFDRAANPVGRTGARAADIMLCAAAGRPDFDGQPEMLAAKEALADLPAGIHATLPGNPPGDLVWMLQEQLFTAPLVKKYRAAAD